MKNVAKAGGGETMSVMEVIEEIKEPNMQKILMNPGLVSTIKEIIQDPEEAMLSTVKEMVPDFNKLLTALKMAKLVKDNQTLIKIAVISIVLFFIGIFVFLAYLCFTT
jgi:hypothetical protein